MDKTKISLESSVIRLPYAALLEEFTEKNLKKADMELKMKDELSERFICDADEDIPEKGIRNGRQWTLIIDRGNECWIINGLYPAKDQQRGESVLKTIKSAYWENGQSSPPAEIPQGNVDVYGTPLTCRPLDGAVVYTKDGFLPRKKRTVLCSLYRASQTPL